ncbi:maltase A1-like isoform X2 [Plodia interpunctella]|uniref:maltase A1-like isoform X2 n=1 Tax=Plodia interpunctella TaxID=58824 RepID=UPI002368E876|nr:maltase A1-like isoform X2 [Plodia interpunctella]
MRVATLLVLAVAASAAASDADWWQTALIYQIYPRSFKDSDGDGIGDLNGITEKLPYLQQLGVDAIWLSPIYLSPMYDFGYDITNYTKIAPEYGTMEDFDNLMAKAKALGIRVVLDYVPNHTGNESEWFIKSAQREAGYENYYIWADGTPDPNDASTTLPPNNWVSNFRKSAWEYSTTRGQYYLHQFAIGQPDLNYREAKVQEEMKNVLRFWLDKGVSGFRVDAINMMYEVDPNDYGGVYPDEPLSGDEDAAADDYNYLSHIYTRDLNETYNVVYDWRDLLDEYYMTDGEYKIMMTEAYTELTLMIRYYGTDTRNGSIPFNFSFLENIKNNSNARDMKLVIDKWMTYMPNGKTANWVNGNHDQSRVASRQGSDRVDAMNLLALLLPGVALTYQFYKDVLAVRKLPAVRAGDLETTVISESVLVVSRLLPGYPGVVGIVNLSDEEYHLDLTSIKLLPVQMRVVASGVDCPHKKDEWMRKSNITVTAHCALLLQTVRKCC